MFFYNAMDYRIEELRFVLQRDPASRQFYQLGELLRRESDLDGAVEVLTNGLKHHPTYVAAWVSLGRALQQGGRYAQASEAFAKALKIDPENAVAARNLGFVLIELRDWSRAVEVLERAVQLIPGDEELTEALAHARSHVEEAGDAGRGGESDEVGPQPSVSVPNGEAFEPVVHVGGDEDEDGGGPGSTVESEPAASAGPPESRDVSVPDEDPFEAVPRGDTGVWVFEGDVFGMVVTAPSGGEDVGKATTPGETGAETGLTEEGIPFPTATLARLALEQNDLDLAERTARAVLAQNPGSSLAQDVLDEADRRRVALAEEGSPADLAALKIAALRGWLETVTLASEKRVP